MGYYTVKELHKGIYSIFEPKSVFSYLLAGSEKALLYDTGFGEGLLLETVREITGLPLEVVLSHGHPDHVGGVTQFEYAHIHPAEYEVMGKSFEEARSTNIRPLFGRRTFELGGMTVDVIPLEGHTMGSIGLLVREERVLLASDALGPHIWMFLPESLSIPAYTDMLTRIKELPFDTFYIGHSDTPRPKAEIDVYKTVAQNIDPEKSTPYPQFSKLGGMLYREGDAAIVFNPKKIKRYWNKIKPIKSIHINQLGYRPDDVKKAVIATDAANVTGAVGLTDSIDSTNNTDVTEYNVVRETDGTVVYTGTAGPAIYNAASDEKVRVADFSELKIPGKYILRAGGESSFPFEINDTPYAGLRRALLDFFHYQKCGVDLECGIWSHPACHATLATVYGTDEKKDVSGGWHDAGDYGRYIVPAAVTVADLLLAHERAANPDDTLLDETWFELEWMLKMQDEKTGGVYHKVSCHQFNALDEMPHDEHEELIISPISATATADFAACMALAARFYPEKQDELLSAAEKAWDWCVANPDVPGFMNPEGVRTGGYGDRSDKDERFWAAVELFAATGEEKYHAHIKDYAENNEIDTGLGWGAVGMYGVIAYLQNAGPADPALTARMKDILLGECTRIMDAFNNDPYGVSLGVKYNWGSNMTVGNNAQILLFGTQYAKSDADREAYTQAAMEHMHYLLGRNSISYSYITGFGANAYKNPHHRPSVAKGQAVPGMVAGGPNMFTTQDPALREHCTGCPPAQCYVDHQGSFSANEITIYWNSPVYFVMAVLDI